jgi:hypothetical protein
MVPHKEAVMRRMRIAVALVILIVCSLSAWPAAKAKLKTASKTKPELRQVIVYMWALSTGGMEVDVRKGKLECFVRGVRLGDQDLKALDRKKEKGYHVYHVADKLSNKEIDGVKDLVETSGLRDFTPTKSDVIDRQPALDECPPTIVLVWSDRLQSLGLPLHNTVKGTIPAGRRKCYKSMGRIVQHLFALTDMHSKLSSISWTSKEDYKAFEKKRDSLLKRAGD